jgi:hypothetical protein
MANESIKDEIARIAAGDLFGGAPEGQQMKETYEQTGRVALPESQRAPIQRSGDSGNENTPQVTVVTPIDYKKIAQAVTEQQLTESLMDEGEVKEKEEAITIVANECVNESKAALSKLLRGLR